MALVTIAKCTFLVVILAYLSRHLYIFLAQNGVAVRFNNVHPGPCRVIPGISCGSEQISVTLDGLAFITNGFRGLTRCNKEFLKGNLYLFNFNYPGNNVTKLKILGERINLDTFDPHGMDIFELSEDIVKLYVVNHASGIESVEVFEYNKKVPNEIVHLASIVDAKFVCINDVTIVNEHKFYVTNYMKYCKLHYHMMLIIEAVFHMETANIVYYNHGQTEIVVKNGLMFNGITLSKEKTNILTMSSSTKYAFIYDRNEADGHLTFNKKVFLVHNPDNIYMDKQTGNFYIAYYKDPLTLHAVAKNISEYSSAGGAMLSIESDGVGYVDVKELFYDNGETFVSGASSFVHYKGQYLLGTVFDKLGYCKEKQVQ